MAPRPFADLVAPHIRDMPAYTPGKPVEEAAREFGLNESDIVKLASNENPLGMGEKAKAAVVEILAQGARYPDPHGYRLRQALTAKLSVEAGQIVLGNGSSDLIVMVANAFLGAGTSVVYSQYAFSAYETACRASGAEILVAPAVDYGHDLEAMLGLIRPDTRLVFIANPNNPTGTILTEVQIRAFLDACPKDVVVVLDEAYREYLKPEDRRDTVSWIVDYPNLFIIRTLSKAYGLAGLRIGYGVGSVEVAGLVNRLRQTFNCNLLAQAAAIAALDDEAHLQLTYDVNRAGLAQLRAGFDKLGLAYVPSDANFLMVEVPAAGETYRALLQKGVIVRPLRPNYGLNNHLRITVGTEAENRRFLEALTEVLSAQAAA